MREELSTSSLVESFGSAVVLLLFLTVMCSTLTLTRP